MTGIKTPSANTPQANGQSDSSPQGANGGAVQVQFNNGQNIARVPTTPGEIVTLPFDGDFQAKLGEQGNLAIKLGDRIVILQNYAEANQESGVTVKDDKGHVIDVASVLASTDPNLDIQTAAGPAAGPAGGTGSGIFLSFAGGSGLGGLGELGTIGQTELQYQTISTDENITAFGDAGVSVTVPALGIAGTEVDEAGLPDGSHPDDPTHSKSTSGAITVSAPDGVASISINGTIVTLSQLQHLSSEPITIKTADGDLTLTGWNGSSLSYTYTLTHNTSGDHTSDNVSIIVTDSDGDQGSGTLVIGIHDDVPTAQNDDLTIAPADFAGHQGNVITAAGEDSAADADVKGADGATVTSIHAAGASDQTVSGEGTTTVTGEYGTLAIAADGSYTYTRNEGTPGGVTDSFTYTLTDGDGDTTTATLTIHIGDSGVTVTLPDGETGGTVVSEAGLDPNGSHHGDGSNVTSGSITVDAPDTVKTIQIGSLTLDASQLADLSTHNQTITTSEGTLTLTGWDGTHLSYTYTLNTNTDGDSTTDSFDIVVTDLDGDTNPSSALIINIVDDTPTAVNDSGEVKAGEYSATGNVESNDTKGADGASVTSVSSDYSHDAATVSSDGTVTIKGEYGTLTIDAAGDYTYTRNANTPGGVTDTFTYTLTDGDSDASTATLTINIDDATPTVTIGTCGDDMVSEAGLANGSHHGNGSNITSGSITYTEGDGSATITINGQAIKAGDTITTTDGKLHIDSISNGVISYTYTLTTNTSGDHTSDNFSVVVTDQDGDKATGTLTIDIVDDRPTARDDSGEVSAGKYSTHGNVMTNDTQGADGASVSKVTGAGGSDSSFDNQGHLVVTGQYGTLTISADGSYSYVRNANTPGGVTDSFTYTLKDGDGDTSTATLTINIDDAKPTLDLGECGGDTVSEAGLANGSHHGDHSNVTSGSITYTQGDGTATVTINGQAISAGMTITTADGKLHIDSVSNGVINYTYTLTTNTSGDHTSDNFSVVVTDQDGDKATGTLTIDIVDDRPTARNDSGEVNAGTYSAHGNVVTNDTQGADGASVSKVTGAGGSDSSFDNQGHLVVTGQYGTLTISADGSYSYVRNANTPGGVTDSFTYTLKDGDGDTSTATLTINIDDAKPTLDLGECGGDTVSEAGLANGSHHGDHSNVTSGSITYTQGDGTATVTINGQAISAGMTITTADGKLHIDSVSNGAINYTYTLTTNTSGDHTSDNFSVVVTDQDGDKATGTLTIDIVDDRPTARNDSGEVNAGAYSAHGNVVTNDTQGADGASVSKVTGAGGSDSSFDNQGHLVVTGQYGTLTISADGSYSYVRNANTPGGVTDTFTYTLKDGDGDTSTATLAISIDDAKPTLDLGACGVSTVSEAGLANGTHHGDGSNVTTGTFTYTEGDGSSTISINGQTIHVGDTITTATGSLHIDSIANGTVGYTYTLTHNTSGDNTADSFNVVVQDQDGDKATGTLTIGIVDDAPAAVSASATVDEDAIASGHQGSPGIEGGPGDIGVVGNTAHIDLSGIKFGADGGKVSFDTSAQPTTLTSDGHTVQYRTETETVDGHTVQALIGYITYYSADNNSSTEVDVFKLTVDPTTQSADFTLLQPLDHPVKGTEDTLDIGLKYTVTDGDGDKATGTITVHVNDDSPTAGTVSSPTVTEPDSTGTTGAASYEIDAGNYSNNAHIAVTAGFVDGNGNLMTINGDTPTINTNPAGDGSTGLGVTSTTDGNGAARFDEINYLGNGSQHDYSETMIFNLKDSDKVATSATVNLSEFYANEGGVGDEKGAYILYKDGVAVSGWIEFEASSTSGSMTLNITGPAGGFDEIRFIAIQGSANPNGNSGSDSSDYSVHDVTFNVVDTPHVNSVTGSLPVAFGADGPGSVALADGPTGLTYNGVAIVNTLVNGILVGTAGSTVVYTLTLSSDGHGNYNYEFDLAKPIDGTQSGNPLAFHYTVTDNDGDKASGTIDVNVTDAAPQTPTALVGDIILTNSLDGSVHVSDFALLRNDSGSNLTVTGVGNADGTVNHDSTTGTTYQFSGGANDFAGSGKMDESNGNSDNWGDSRYSPTTISRTNFAQSSTLNTGTLQMTGALNSSSDVDAFKIHLQAGEVLYGSLFGTGNHGANVDVKIYDSTGHLVAESGYQTASHGWGYYNVPADGDYYIVIDGQTGNGNNSAGGQGTYELDLNILSQASTDGSFHYQAGGSDATVTVDGVSGGAGYGHDQHQVIGTSANEILVGDSHQHNYLNGGGGDDTIMYQVGDTIDGGGNSHSGQNGDLGGSYLGDVLDVSELSGSVDLHSAISDGHIKNIDTVSMIGGSGQSVELNINDVLQIGNGTFSPTSNEISGLQSKDAVKVEGSSGDSLTLDNGSGGGHWVNVTDHVSNVPAGHQVYAYDGNGGSFNANDVQGYVIVGNNVTVHDEHNQVIPQL